MDKLCLAGNPYSQPTRLRLLSSHRSRSASNRILAEIATATNGVETLKVRLGSPTDPHSFAQDATSFRGRITDGDGRPIIGATVSVLAEDEESEQLAKLTQVQTDEKGSYTLLITILNDRPQYILSVTGTGFDRFLAVFEKGVKPPVTIVLEASSPAGEPSIETAEATRRHVFPPQLMQALPVPGFRSFDSFALLAPGVAPPPNTPNARGPGVSPGLGTAGQFAVNGLRSRENSFAMDGSDNNDEDIGTRRQGFVALAPQPIESLHEFQIVTALGDARFGRNIGGHVNALTKSGSPQFHGSVYGFFTDDSLNARDAFDRVAPPGQSFTLTRQFDGAEVLLDGSPIVTPDPARGKNLFTRSQVGFVVGGPINWLNSFFFGSLERVTTRANKESHFIVPTVEQRGILDAGATGLMLDGFPFPPFSRPLYSANIPGNAIFSLYPFPNNPLGPFARNTYTTILPADASGTRFSAKMDRQFGKFDVGSNRRPWSLFRQGDNLTGRYNSSRETSVVPVTGEALFSSLRPRVRTQNIAFYINRSLTSRISDVIRLSFGHTKQTLEKCAIHSSRRQQTSPGTVLVECAVTAQHHGSAF